jgi:hypothetical protein
MQGAATYPGCARRTTSVHNRRCAESIRTPDIGRGEQQTADGRRSATPGPGHSRCCRRRRAGSLAFLAVSKRSAGIAVLAALVVGVVIGIAWHEPKGMDLPDGIRTWAGFVVVIVGAGVALWQLDMQRRQLADQKDVLTQGRSRAEQAA